MGSFMHATEGEMVCESINPKIPYFNAPIYLENKTAVGKVDEILGPLNQVFFTIKPQEGIVATSFKAGDKFYIGGDKLLPLERYATTAFALSIYMFLTDASLGSFPSPSLTPVHPRSRSLQVVAVLPVADGVVSLPEAVVLPVVVAVAVSPAEVAPVASPAEAVPVASLAEVAVADSVAEVVQEAEPPEAVAEEATRWSRQKRSGTVDWRNSRVWRTGVEQDRNVLRGRGRVSYHVFLMP